MEVGKVWNICNLGPRSRDKCQLLPSPPPSKCPTSSDSHLYATIMGISEAAFTQPLKGQISSIVSSLSAFSNHSHGFMLFILIVLLMIGVTLCLQLPQRSQGLAVSNWGPERAMAAYFHSSPSIDFPSVWEWPRWLLLVLSSRLLFFLAALPHFSLEKAVCSHHCDTRGFTETNPHWKQGRYIGHCLIKSACTWFFLYSFSLLSSQSFNTDIWKSQAAF